jgi:organic hydroperoxide reductase OsmC/OhrA
MTDNTQPARQCKVHTFTTSVKWTGDRTWVLKSRDAPEIHGSSPPVFGGQAGNWSPEDLMIASVNACTLSTFISLSLREGFEFISYESTIEGILERPDKGYLFTKMIIRPRIQVASAEDIPAVLENLEKAHRNCFMGNSVRSEIILEPEVTVKN